MADLERPVQIDVEPDLEGRIVVRVQGPLDLPEVGDLRAVFSNLGTIDCPDVVLDLTGVSFLGSSGMGTIAELHQDLATRDRHLLLRGASPTIRKAFSITGLDRLLDLEDDAVGGPVEPDAAPR
ncbi:MAG TPA: STAS domain-containing protein [Acidimicrobiales bacterium]|jgi:anti-sigma B factor antagonist|nr:STAS domain-containing protein [Acidimicrobiales bacterium]